MTKRLFIVCLFLSLLVLLPAAAGQEQSATPIQYGQTLEGQATDITTINFYTFDAPGADAISIFANSDSVDMYLLLYDASGNVLSQNDDISTVDLNARIDFTLPGAGQYFIGVAGYTAGAYTVSLVGPEGSTSTGQSSSVETTPIAYGETLTGEATSPEVLNYYFFTGTQGDTITIDATSNTIDTYAFLYDAAGNLLAQNDDISSSNLNSQVVFTLTTTGDYYIGVTGYTPGQYAVALSGGSAAATSGGTETTATALQYGQTASGQVPGKNEYATYSFQGNAGETVAISVTSGAIDPYIFLLDASGAELATNDDISTSDLNAYIEQSLPAAGEYFIAVGGYSAGEFSISLNTVGGGGTTTVSTTSEPVGTVYTGNIDDAQPFISFPVTGVPQGATIVADVQPTSGDLDTYLVLMQGETVIAENDDRTQGDLSSRIEMPNATAGDYVVFVTRYGVEKGETAGTFELAIDVSSGATALPPVTTPVTTAVDPVANGYPANNPQPMAEWTVLAYMGGDNNLEGALLNDINEFELAGGSDQTIKIVAFVDRSPEFDDSNGNWTGVQLLEVTADTSADNNGFNIPTVDSRVLANLGDLDSSYPNNLTDFLVWGMTNYPARHYIVALNDHGGAWQGIVTDDTAGRGQILTIPELQQSFQTALQATGVSKFDMLINDACLMSSIEYYGAIYPYFDFVVSSPELTFNPSFDMEVLTRSIKENPAIDPGVLGQRLMDKYLQDMATLIPDVAPIVGGAVTDLRNFESVLTSLNEFTRIVSANPDAYASSIGQARSNAYTYTYFLPEDQAGPATNMDLGHFLGQLSAITNDQQLLSASQNLIQSLSSVLVYGTAGADLTRYSTFYNIYFPADSADFYPAYFEQSPLQNWGQMLRGYYTALGGGSNFRAIAGVGATPSPSSLLSPSNAPSIAPDVAITNVYPSVTSVATPTVVWMEVTGRNISHGDFTVDYVMPDGTVVRYDEARIMTNVVIDGVSQQVNSWSPGVDDTRFTWDVSLPVVTDGTTSANEIVTYNNGVTALAGRYQFPGEIAWQEVSLLFDDNGQSTRMVALSTGGATALANISPVAGGVFQTYRSIVTPDGRVVTEPGTTYTWNDSGLSWYSAPAPTGTYRLGFLVTAFGGSTGFNSVEITVNNDNVNPDLTGYVDYDWGFVLQHPSSWFDMTYFPDSEYLLSANDDDSETMFIYPVYDSNGDLQAIMDEVNGRYSYTAGNITPITVGGKEALEFTFDYVLNDSTYVAKGFAVYIENLALGLVFSAEVIDPARLDPVYAILRDNLSFFDIVEVLNADTGRWDRQYLDDVGRVPVPAGWDIYDSGDAVWTIYTPETPDESGFVATSAAVALFAGRTDGKPLMNELLTEYVAYNTAYELIDTEIYYGENHQWETATFRYTSPAGAPVVGRMHVTVVNGTAYALWFEVPEDTSEDIMRGVYDIMLDGFKVEAE